MDGDQPPDDGMALMAHIGGDLASPAAPVADNDAEPAGASDDAKPPMEDADLAEAARVEAEPVRKRRSRRNSASDNQSVERPAAKDAIKDEAKAEAPVRRRRARKSDAVGAGVPEAESAAAPVAEAVPPAVPEPAVPETAAPVAAAPEPVVRPEPLPEAPPGPKRGGWWQKTKAALGGN